MKRKKQVDYAESFVKYFTMLHPELSLPRCKQHPKGELQFARCVGRLWQFDVADEETKVAVEIDGGKLMAKWSPTQRRCVVIGRHNQDEDLEKLNTARDLGWIVYQFTPAMLKKDPVGCVERVYNLILERKTQVRI